MATLILFFLVMFGSALAEDVNKRILLSDDQYIHQLEVQFQEITTRLNNQEAKLNSQTTQLHKHEQNILALQENSGKGGMYVRWGSKSCPRVNGTDMVYSGYAGGSWYNHYGAAANYLCMPPDPHLTVTTTETATAYVYGVEYERKFLSNVYNDDAPCAVCRSSFRTSVLMIPGRRECYPGWAMEYGGFLTAGEYNVAAATEYVCLDQDPESLNHSTTNDDGAGFYFTSSKCGSLPCPPYVDNAILPCVVCTK